MSKLICKLFKHDYISHDEATLLRALVLDSDAEFCGRCGLNTVGAGGGFMNLLCRLGLHKFGVTQYAQALSAEDWRDVRQCQRCPKRVITKPGGGL